MVESMALKMTIPDYTNVPSKEEEFGSSSAKADEDAGQKPTDKDSVEPMDVVVIDDESEDEPVVETDKAMAPVETDKALAPAISLCSPVTGEHKDIADANDRSAGAKPEVTGKHKDIYDANDISASSKPEVTGEHKDIADANDKSSSPKPKDGDKDTSSKPESGKTDIPFASYKDQDTEKQESHMEVDADKPGDSVGESASDDENNSLLEAVNVAHSLIDSLSPAKAPSFPPSEGQKTNNIPKLTLAEPVNKSACIDLTDSPPVVPTMTKTGSYGFTVSGILSPECKPTDSNLFKPSTEGASTWTSQQVGEPSVSSANGQRTQDNKDMVKSEPIVVPGTVPVLPDLHKAVVTELSSTDLLMSPVVASGSLTSSSTSPFMISNILSVSSAGNSTLVPTQSGQIIPVPNLTGHQLGAYSSGNQLIPQSSASISSPSSVPHPVSAVSSAVSSHSLSQGRTDHGYAKDSGYKSAQTASAAMFGGGDSGIVSMATGQGGQMRSVTSSGSGRVPVTQSLQSSFESMLLDPGLRSAILDMDDRSPGGRKGQKRKRISLATEEIMMYGKRRSTRVRNTGRKKVEETVNFTDLLLALLPSTLKYEHIL